MNQKSLFLSATITCPACGRTEAEAFAEVGPRGLEMVDCAACDAILPAAMVAKAGIESGLSQCMCTGKSLSQTNGR